MVYRGIVKEVPYYVNNGWKFTLWLMVVFHRYHYPYFVFMLLFGATGAYYLQHVSFLGVMFLMIEVFYLSIAFHEAAHMSFAKFASVKTVSISLIPCSIEIRTNFSRERKIAREDLCAILLAGPLIPIFTCFVFLLIGIVLKMGSLYYVCCAEFLIINILSLLPFKGSDGGRVFTFLREKPHFWKVLLASQVYYIYKKSKLEELKTLFMGG